MGIFDELITALKDGTVEKALNSAVDKLESGVDTAIEKVEQGVTKVEQQSKTVDEVIDKQLNDT
jgi:putative component of toxin-antitoxin plasmid stabilization module